MKRIFLLIVTAMLSMCSTLMAQDQIIGTYKVLQNGVNSKVKIFKYNDGYRAQVIWVDNLKKSDGTIRTDEKNPDANKRSVRADQIVVIDKITYDKSEKIWNNGKIYDPTKGKTYKAEISFQDSKTLQIKGFLGPFHQSVYWTKIE